MTHSLQSDCASVDDHLYCASMISNEVQNLTFRSGLYTPNLPLSLEHLLSFLQDVSFFISKNEASMNLSHNFH